MAFPNDMSRLAGTFINAVASKLSFSSDDNKAKAAHQMIRRTFVIPKATADAATSTTTAANAAPGSVVAPWTGRILGAKYLAGASVTASNTDYATLSIDVVANGLAGGASVAAFSATTKTTAGGGTGNLVAGQYAELALSNATAARFSRGAVIGPSIAKAGAGIAIPAGAFQVAVELEGVDEYEV
jgi:hypothetical protein